MKRLLLLFCSVVLFYNLSYGQEKIKIAVLDFPALKGVTTKVEAEELSKELANELSKVENFEIFSGEALSQKMKESKVSLKKLLPKNFQKMSAALNVDYVLYGDIFQMSEVQELTSESSMKRGDTVITSKLVYGEKVVLLDEYVTRIYIVDTKDGSVKYLVKDFSPKHQDKKETMSEVARKVSDKILANPREVVIISNFLYIYPENLGPIDVYRGYYSCQELNTKKMYGYDDWRAPTEEEIEIIMSNKKLLKNLNLDGKYDYMLWRRTDVYYNVLAQRIDTMTISPIRADSYHYVSRTPSANKKYYLRPVRSTVPVD